MGVYEEFVRPVLFKMDPEKVHNLGLSLIAAGLVETAPYEHQALEQRQLGIKFANPIGLAAGVAR